MAAKCEGKKNLMRQRSAKINRRPTQKRADFQLMEGPAASTNNQRAVNQKHLLPVPQTKKPDSANLGVGNETKHGYSRLG